MKWGILATGTIAKKFASTVEQMGAEGEQLVAVGSRHLESAQAFAQQYSIPRCYDRKRRNKQLPVCRADRHLKTTKNECWRRQSKPRHCTGQSCFWAAGVLYCQQNKRE